MMKFPIRVLNKLFRMHVGTVDRPVIFNVADTFPALLKIDENASTIKDELLEILSNNENIPKYHELDSNQVSISGNDDKSWRVFILYSMGMKPKNNRKLCPKTTALLDDIPDLFQAMFSILEPGKFVPAHHGGYVGMLRYHLGLVIPEVDPPSIRVKDSIYTWKEGESVFFDDTWEHEVFNESKSMRVILMIDVLRPMPFYLHLINYLYSYCVIYFDYGKKVTKNVERYRLEKG